MEEIFEKICQAAFNGNAQELKLLLNDKIDLNQNGKNWTPLHSAIESQNLECLKLLIEYGADVEFIGNLGEGYPLEHEVDIAIQSNNNTGGKEGDENLDIINALLDAGANPNTALSIAKTYGSEKILTKLNLYLQDKYV